MKGQGSCLFGHNWLQHIRLNWSSINKIPVKSSIQVLFKKDSHLFLEELVTLEDTKAKIIIPPNDQPCFFKPRPLRTRFEKELDRLQLHDFFTPVQFSDLLFMLSRQMAPFMITVNTVSIFTRRLVHSPVRMTIVFKAGPLTCLPATAAR